MKKIIRTLCLVSILSTILYLILLNAQYEALLLSGEHLKSHELSLLGESPQLWWLIVTLVLPIIILMGMRRKRSKSTNMYYTRSLNIH